MAETAPILVVLGIDIDSKPHASRFAEHDAPFVQRAAELMGFHVIQIAPDYAELHGIAEGLPLGKIFATGRAFVPFVARAAFDELTTLVEGGVTTAATRPIGGKQPGSSDPTVAISAAKGVETADALWSKIEIGTIVLTEQPDVYGPGRWEGVVVAIDGDDLTLRWIDPPPDEPFHASRRHVSGRNIACLGKARL
jgi:hypothetical protein